MTYSNLFHGNGICIFFSGEHTFWWKKKIVCKLLNCATSLRTSGRCILILSVQEGLKKNRAGDLVLMSICGHRVHWH